MPSMATIVSEINRAYILKILATFLQLFYAGYTRGTLERVAFNIEKYL